MRKLEQKRQQLLSRHIRQQEARAGAALERTRMVGQEPWRVLGEGDSWIHYTCGLGVMHNVEWMLKNRAVCVNIGGSGMTMARMMKLPARQELDDQLRKGINGKPWDALIFSGGGNDFAGDEFVNWLVPYAGQTHPTEAIDEAAFSGLLNHMATLYHELGALVMRLSPATKVFVNAYDFAIPDGRHVLFSGPWMRPGFHKRGYAKAGLPFCTAVVRIMLERFAAMISSVSVTYPAIRLAPTQGKLLKGKKDWDNELHPTRDGFRQIARIFVSELEAHLP